MRVFDPTSYGATALTFRRFGPLLRFDHQRGAGVDAHGLLTPALDPDRGIYYAGATLGCCIVEVFGDQGDIETGQWCVAGPITTRELRLLDLRGSGAMRAGSITALAKVPDHALAQEWSRYFYETAIYEEVDGLLYSNAHNDEKSYALYERAGAALHCPPARVVRLDDPALRPKLLSIARKNNLVLSP